MQRHSVSEILQSTTVRIETFANDREGLVSTGLIYEFRSEENTYPFLVTTRHSIDGAGNGRITLVPEDRGRPALGKGYTLDIDNFEQLWHRHPDEAVDLAVTPFVPFVRHVEESGIPVFFNSLNEQSLWQPGAGPEPSPLEEVVFVGYPSGISDARHMLPVLSRGITATPLGVDYRGERHLVINGPLYPGCSGSPVFLLDKGAEADDASGETVRLLGCMTSGYDRAPGKSGRGLRPLGELFDDEDSLPGDFAGVLRASLFVDLIQAYLKEKGFI